MDTGGCLVSLHGREGWQPVDLQPAGDVGGRLIVKGKIFPSDGKGDGEVPVRICPDLLGLDVLGRPPHEDPAAGYSGCLGEDGDNGGHPGLTGGVVLMPLGH